MSAFSSFGSSFGGMSLGGRSASNASEAAAGSSGLSRTSSRASSVFTDSDASDGEVDDLAAVDGLRERAR